MKVVKYHAVGVPEATRYWEISGDAARFGLGISAEAPSLAREQGTLGGD